MTDDLLPAAPEPPISDDVRQLGIDFLQGLLADGRVELDRFQEALDELLRVETEADFASIIRGLPPPVAFTAPSRRRHEPLEISTGVGEVRLEGRWQVSRLTTITADMGSVIIDLTEAEFDDREVEIVVRARMGSVTVIAPRGLEVRLVGKTGPVSHNLEPPVPGFPVVRLSATLEMGTVSVIHPKEKRERRRIWRRRRNEKALPP